MKALFIFCLVAIALCGCGLDDAVNQMKMSQFQEQCTKFGFQPGTTAYSNCLMQQSVQRDQFNHHIVDQVNRQNAVDQLTGK